MNRLSGRAALLGVAAWWIVGAARPATTDLAAIGRVLELQLLVLVPILLGLDPERRENGLVLPAALVAVASGHLASPILAGAWLLLALSLLLEQARRFAGGERAASVLLDGAAIVFLLVGAGWLLIDRAGLTFLGLSAEQIRLAAVHSHTTGFGVLALAAASARRRERADLDAGPLLWAGAALALAFAVIANGIAFAPAIEPIGAAILALALGALVGLELAGPTPASRLARRFRLASIAALGLGLGVALTYSLRSVGVTPLARAQMILLHGWVLGGGFLLLGALGHALAARTEAPRAPALLLYDGVCGLCDQTVQTLLKLDPEGDLRFAPLQGETADPILERAGIASRDDFDSILLVRDPGGPREHIRTEFEGARAVLDSLASPTYRGLGRALRLIPTWLGDLGYRLVARNRRRIWGTLDACRVPTPAERARVLP